MSETPLYAKINSQGDVLKYPYTPADGEELVAEVYDNGVPALAEGQTLDQGFPINSNGVYLRNWIVHDWLAIEPGSLYARVDAQGNVLAYPYTAADIRRDNPDAIFPAMGIIQMDGEFGVVPVAPTGRPPTDSGFVAVEATPTFDGTSWVQAWEIRARTPEEFEAAKAERRAAVTAMANAYLTGGCTIQSGPLAGHTLDTRNMEDRTNWLTSQAAYSAAVASGYGDVMDATFRTANDETVTVTYAEGLSALLTMAAWGRTIMGNSWALKDAIIAAQDWSELEAIDITTGWQS